MHAELKMTENVEVVRTDRGYAVISARSLAANERILTCEGVALPAPNRYSVCIDGEHIDPETPARFLNHSCEPNCRFEGHWLLASDDIAASVELTFDYAETEAVIAAPFDCTCGSSNCRGRIGL